MSEEQKEKQLIALREKRQIISDELLQLQKDKNAAQKKVDSIKKKMGQRVEAIKNISFSIGQLKGEYKRDANLSGKVSDHAIVRYLERYKGVDILATVMEILEHPDRRYSGDMVTTVYKDDATDHEVKDKIKLIKMRNKRTQ